MILAPSRRFSASLNEGREEVHVEPRRCIKAPHRLGRLDALEAAVTDQTPDDRAVLLLHKGLIVLFIGAGARDLDLLLSAPGDDDIVHEGAIIVEVDAAHKPRK